MGEQTHGEQTHGEQTNGEQTHGEQTHNLASLSLDTFGGSEAQIVLCGLTLPQAWSPSAKALYLVALAPCFRSPSAPDRAPIDTI